MAMEDYLKDSQFGQIAGSILSRKNEDYKKDVAKAVTLEAILQFFKGLKDNRKNTVNANIKVANENEIVALGKDEALWDRRNEILKKEKTIQESSAADVFDSQAESWFNNPENQKNIPNFRPEDFQDPDSPMYKVKNNRKQKYINEVLLPAHQFKMNKIDKNILTFDEFAGKTRARFDAEEKYISRPSEKSLIRRGFNKVGLFTEKDDALTNEYETARIESEALRRKRGEIFSFDEVVIPNIPVTEPYTDAEADKALETMDPSVVEMGNVIRYRNPYEGLTEEELLEGKRYTLEDFKRSEEFKTLQTLSQQTSAIKAFKENENFGDINNEDAITSIVMTSKIIDLEEQRIQAFENIKNNDPDFKKPERNETLTEYNKREDVIAYQNALDEAYSAEDQTPKYLKARKDAGYDIGLVNEYAVEVEEIIDFDTNLTAKHLNIGKVINGKKYTKNNYKTDRENLKNALLDKFVRNKLTNPSNLEQALQRVYFDNVGRLTNWISSEEGKTYINNKKADMQRTAKEGVIITYEAAETAVRRARTKTLSDGYQWNLKNMVLLPSGVITIQEEEDELTLDTLN
tara:strand:+ start:344 stop:2068 length:1725 start_codon:yes stop_codon:yes gene_type:complete